MQLTRDNTSIGQRFKWYDSFTMEIVNEFKYKILAQASASSHKYHKSIYKIFDYDNFTPMPGQEKE